MLDARFPPFDFRFPPCVTFWHWQPSSSPPAPRTSTPTAASSSKDGDPVPTVTLSYYKACRSARGRTLPSQWPMAISGGGSRASNFGIGIMLGLEQISTGERDMLDGWTTCRPYPAGFCRRGLRFRLVRPSVLRPAGPFSLKSYLDLQIREDMAFPYTDVLCAPISARYCGSPCADDGDALERSIDEHVLGYRRRAKVKNPAEPAVG